MRFVRPAVSVPGLGQCARDPALRARSVQIPAQRSKIEGQSLRWLFELTPSDSCRCSGQVLLSGSEKP